LFQGTYVNIVEVRVKPKKPKISERETILKQGFKCRIPNFKTLKLFKDFLKDK